MQTKEAEAIARKDRFETLFNSRFGEPATDPLSGMANLVDVILVFACGLLVALVLAGVDLAADSGVTLEAGEELPEVPKGWAAGGGSQGFESVGRVYRDPNTGRLIMVGEE